MAERGRCDALLQVMLVSFSGVAVAVAVAFVVIVKKQLTRRLMNSEATINWQMEMRTNMVKIK